MKKTIITIAVVAIAMGIGAQAQTKAVNDTTVVSKYNTIKWELEKTTNKAGESKVEYFVTIDGVTYKTTKTSTERAKVIARFNGKPCIVVITTPKGSKRVAIL